MSEINAGDLTVGDRYIYINKSDGTQTDEGKLLKKIKKNETLNGKSIKSVLLTFQNTHRHVWDDTFVKYESEGNLKSKIIAEDLTVGDRYIYINKSDRTQTDVGVLIEKGDFEYNGVGNMEPSTLLTFQRAKRYDLDDTFVKKESGGKRKSHRNRKSKKSRKSKSRKNLSKSNRRR